jgi:RimJ/RimL family protein N-acetyltransferase
VDDARFLHAVGDREVHRPLDRAVGPWQPEGWPGTEVGWGLSRDAWGKGYATEGAVACIDWAFEAFGWDEVIHTIDPANVASQAVARRLGSTILRPGTMPPPYEAMVVDVWGQSREQWMARRTDAARR